MRHRGLWLEDILLIEVTVVVDIVVDVLLVRCKSLAWLRCLWRLFI